MSANGSSASNDLSSHETDGDKSRDGHRTVTSSQLQRGARTDDYSTVGSRPSARFHLDVRRDGLCCIRHKHDMGVALSRVAD